MSVVRQAWPVDRSIRAELAHVERFGILVEGIVQGVGFRPFVYHLASRLRLGGSVRNQNGAVWIEAEGERIALDQFIEELQRSPPPLARIDRLVWEPRLVVGEKCFGIAPSCADGPPRVFVSADVATCAACRAEVFDRRERRYGYPFTNCTDCGPRLTIVTAAPYDRDRTTMAGFAMCRACRAEYETPENRRFHAQPIACPQCGPRLKLLDATGAPLPTDDPLASFAAEIRGGRIAALKSLGGFHLVCRADDGAAVAELRRRKSRDEKPFAIMVADLEGAAALCDLDPPERILLASPRAPIVLLRKRAASAVAEAVAPRGPWLGVMLPPTPLHHLLLHALGRTPLVMTSGNRADEPIAYRDEDALGRLRGIADSFLTHDRPIHVRCDDSVTRIVDGGELPLRRSRGDAPLPIRLAVPCRRPTLAVGGQLKATFALGSADHALLSHHLGDLDHFEAFQAFERDVALYEQLFALRPQRVVHDLHPDYASTRYATQRAARERLELLAVQHHHAHLASCMADNRLAWDEKVIGVIFDGTGCGTDGAIWGGEFLVGDCRDFRRAAHLRYVGMPGGEQAVRQVWRMAASHLRDAGCDMVQMQAKVETIAWRAVQRMLERRFHSPDTSSMGRLFDAVAALVSGRMRIGYEGQAAVELEWMASTMECDGGYPFGVEEVPAAGVPLRIDTRPLIVAVADDIRRGTEARRVARRFHSSVVEMIADVCGRIRQRTGIGSVVISGGVFSNALLTSETMKRLREDSFMAYRHRRVPPGDGGLSLGQLAVAAARDVE